MHLYYAHELVIEMECSYGGTRLEQRKLEKWIGHNRRGPKANQTVLPGL